MFIKRWFLHVIRCWSNLQICMVFDLIFKIKKVIGDKCRTETSCISVMQFFKFSTFVRCTIGTNTQWYVKIFLKSSQFRKSQITLPPLFFTNSATIRTWKTMRPGATTGRYLLMQSYITSNTSANVITKAFQIRK